VGAKTYPKSAFPSGLPRVNPFLINRKQGERASVSIWPADMPREKSSLILLLLALALRTTGFSQHNCIYRVTASQCLHGPTERTQTGFTVKGIRGIFTALHGVADAGRIGAVSRASNRAFNSLQISKVEPERDVALLDSSELDGKDLPALRSASFSEGVDPGPLKVVGHPYGIDLIPTTGLTLRTPKLVQLRSLLTTDSLGPVQDRGSPFYKTKVLSIQGKLLPGDSGAPILDSQNRVLAIANGGLKGGLADISWAIPMEDVNWDDNPEATLARLRTLTPSDVFFFAGEDKIPDEKESATTVANKFLSFMDKGQYGKGWEEFDPNGRSLDKDGWLEMSNQYRAPRGQYTSRTLVNSNFIYNPPGAPPGKYINLIFRSSFYFAPQTIETLTLKLNPDGHWKMFGYVIN
jgi:hypothetical protein